MNFFKTAYQYCKGFVSERVGGVVGGAKNSVNAVLGYAQDKFGAETQQQTPGVGGILKNIHTNIIHTVDSFKSASAGFWHRDARYNPFAILRRTVNGATNLSTSMLTDVVGWFNSRAGHFIGGLTKGVINTTTGFFIGGEHDEPALHGKKPSTSSSRWIWK